MEPYVFVSYSRKQFYVAEQLAAELRGLDLPVWLDVQEIDPGVDWQAAISRGIEGCQAVVVVASRSSYRSQPVQEEIAAARLAGKPMYLAVVGETPLLEQLKGHATVIDCRSAFSERMKVLAQAIRTGDTHDQLLPKRRFFIPRLPFGMSKWVQLLWLNLFFAVGTIAIVWQKQVTVGRITPQALPFILVVGVPVALWFLGFGYSLYLQGAFRMQRLVTYTVLDVWPVLGLFIAPALLFFIIFFNTSDLVQEPFNPGFSVVDRLALDPFSLTLTIALIVALLLTYLAMVFSTLRTIVLVFGAALSLGVLVGLPLPTIIRYPLLLLLGGVILYASLRASITGKGLQDAMGEVGWTTPHGMAGSPASRAWARWLTPGAFASDAFTPRKTRLRERPTSPTPTGVNTWLTTWRLHYVAADRACAQDIRLVFASYPALREVSQGQANYHIVVLSNRTPRRWLDALATDYRQIICVAVSAIDLAALAQPLHQNQWVDYRQQRPEQLRYLAMALAGEGQYVNPTTPENLARPLGPSPVALVSHALRIGGLFTLILGATALLLMQESGLALISTPLAALSIVIGVAAFWEGLRLRVRNTSRVVLLATSALLGLDLAAWLIGAAIVPLAPRAVLTHSGPYNTYLTAGFQLVVYFVGAPLALLFLVGWAEFFRRFTALARWLPRPARPTWRRRLIPPLWKRLDLATGAYGLVALVITTLLVVDSPYQFPKVHEYDVNVAGITPVEMVYGNDGKVWFSIVYGLGYVLPDGTINPVQALTPQPADCGFSPNDSGNLNDLSILYDCYEGSGLQLGPNDTLWYVTDMLYQQNKVQIVRATPAGTTTVFALPNGTKFGTHVHFTFDGAGTLWFTQTLSLTGRDSDSTGIIGRIDAAGHLSTVATLANSSPTSIVAGPDGTLWFTDAIRGGIGKMTPAGTVTFYPEPPSNDTGELIVGGDDHIWFTAPKIGVIGRIATDGASRVFAQPPRSRPEHLVWGPDGALWFLDAGLNTIGRVAPDGTTTRYPLPAPLDQLPPLVVGSDGNLWCALDHQIARITPSGVVTQYALPTLDATVTAIVSAPDQRIWFIEDVGIIGVISPKAQLAISPFTCCRRLRLSFMEDRTSSSR